MYRVPSPEIVSRHFVITFENIKGQPSTQFTALAKTKSGNLVLELDDQLLEVIEMKAKDSPYLFVSLNKTNSGHLIIDIDTKKDVAFNTQEVAIKKTPSGTNLLVMPQKLLNVIQDAEQKIPQVYADTDTNIKTGTQCKPNNDKKACDSVQNNKVKLLLKGNKDMVINTIRESPPVNIELKKSIGTKNATLGETFIESIYNNDSCGSDSEQTDFVKSLYDPNTCYGLHTSLTPTAKSISADDGLCDYSNELQRKYESGNVAIKVLIEAKSQVFKKIETVIIKSPSGTIGANLNMQKSYLQHIPTGATHPVRLSKTTSGSYLVNMDQNSPMFNAVLKKTLSGNIILIPKSSASSKGINIQSNAGIEQFYTIKVAGYKEFPVDLPGVLKLTESGNYIIILDKEFETRYKQTVNEYVGEQRKCYVCLVKTLSGFMIDLNTKNNIPPEELNALLVKSRSGHIKVLVHGAVFECINNMTSRRSSMSSVQIFGNLLNTLHPLSSREPRKETATKAKFITKKASSDTQLYERVKVKLQVDKNLFTEPSAILKQTETGQYAVVLNKESKKTFINKLRSYLTSNPKGLVPIKRTNSGQIIIVLNNEFEGKGHYGSLKITSSGNIYILVDEDALSKLTQKCKKDIKLSNAASMRSVKSKNLTKGVDKAVTTTCNARPEDCDCNTSKCVCAELEFETIDWLDRRNVITRDNTGRFREPMCWMKPRRDSKNKCSEDCTTTINTVTTIQKDTSPYIVIKPAPEGRPRNQSVGSTSQCYYLFDTVCPYHIDRYNGVSNELLEISGLCNKPQKKLKNNVEFTSKAPEAWDSLSYLPPQLPPFLSNVNYR